MGRMVGDIAQDVLGPDAHAAYGRLREEGAACSVRDPNGFEYWLITRYAAARAALADRRLAKDPTLAWDALRAAGIVGGEARDFRRTMLTSDPPHHTRLRAIVSAAFTPRRVEELRPRVQQITASLLDALASRSTVDLITDFAHPLSLTVICELLGIPVADQPGFRRWTTAALTPTYVRDQPLSRAEGSRLLHEYAEELVTRKRAEVRRDGPADAQPDLISALLVAHEQEGRLSGGELVEMAQFLLFSGHETTTNLIGNGMLALLDRPDQLDALRARPELIATAVEELLRFDGPTARTSPRFALEDIDVEGIVIPAGSVVIVGLAAANRDPRRFTEPDQLDVERAPCPHIAFGHGSHHCLGAPLARMEAQIAIGALLDRFPRLALAVPRADLQWRPLPTFRGLVELPVVTG